MNAALSTASSPVLSASPALTLVLVVSVAALIAIGVAVRKLRVHGDLTIANASLGAATASFVVAGALFCAVAVGAPAQALTVPTTNTSTTLTTPTQGQSGPHAEFVDPETVEPVELEGYQLPTE